MFKPKLGRIEQVNKELWILLSLFAICLMLNLVVDGQRMVLSFYTLPTLGVGISLRPPPGTLTALGSVLLVCIMTWYNPVLFAATTAPSATPPAGSTSRSGAACSSSPGTRWARCTSTRRRSSPSCARPITAC